MQEIKNIPVSEAVCEKLTSKYEQLYALFHVSIRVDSMYMKQATDTFMLADSWPSDVFVKSFLRLKWITVISLCVASTVVQLEVL